jgi:hypothetical protein
MRRVALAIAIVAGLGAGASFESGFADELTAADCQFMKSEWHMDKNGVLNKFAPKHRPALHAVIDGGMAPADKNRSIGALLVASEPEPPNVLQRK